MKWLLRIWHLIGYCLWSHPTGVARSGQWRRLEEKFLMAYPKCAACGGEKWLNVHHCIPFHLAPEKELAWDNLITMCMGEKECHLRLAHGGNWSAFCPDIKIYIKQIQQGEKSIEEMIIISKQQRRYTL